MSITGYRRVRLILKHMLACFFCLFFCGYLFFGYQALAASSKSSSTAVKKDQHASSKKHAVNKQDAPSEHEAGDEALSDAIGEDMPDDGTADASSAAAAASHSFMPVQGLYIGINGGYAETSYQHAFGGNNHWDAGMGNGTLGATYGYQFMKHLALEIGYQYVFPAKATRSAGAGYSTMTPQIVSGTVKAIIPLFKRMQFFTKSGLAYVHQTIANHDAGANGAVALQESKRSRIGAALGAGFSVFFTPNIYMDVTYMHYAGVFEADQSSSIAKQIPNLNLYTVSIGYYFGW